jgi:hypothetical protein
MRTYYQKPPSKSHLYLLIWLISIVSVLSPIISYTLWYFFKLPGPSFWLPLTWSGLQNHYYWQIVTYPLVHSADQGFTLALLLSTTFNLGILSFTAEEVVGRFRHRGFLLYFLLLVLAGGLGATLYILLAQSLSPFYGLTPILFGLALTWGMLMPTLELQLAFIYKVKATQLITTALSLCFIYLLLGGYFATAVAALFCMATTFVYAHFVWGLPNPYFKMPKLGKAPDLNIFYGNRESDEEFMERMLDKIHTKGLHSLSKAERARMESISKRKHH